MRGASLSLFKKKKISYRPTAREYILKGTHCRLLTGSRPEIGNKRSMLFNQEKPLSLEEVVVCATKEESWLTALGMLVQVESQAFATKANIQLPGDKSVPNRQHGN